MIHRKLSAQNFEVEHTAVSGQKQFFPASLRFHPAPGGGTSYQFFMCGGGEPGDEIDVAARDTGKLISIALQRGVGLQDLAVAMERNPDGTPRGLAGAAVDRCLLSALHAAAWGDE